MSVKFVSREIGWLEVIGPDRAAWLQGMVSNDVVSLKPGSGCYAAHLTPQGKVIADMVVTADETSLWLMTAGAAAPKLHAALDRLLIMEDAQIRDASPEFVTLSLWGDGLPAALFAWKACRLPDALYAWIGAGEFRVSRSETGADLRIPAGHRDAVADELRQVGAITASWEEWNVSRVEAGLPQFGIDFDDTTTLPEIGERAISYDKGCYVGQEVVAKIKYIGHVNRKLVGLDLGSEPVVPARTRLQRNGKDAGFVTSSVHSERFGRTIALAVVQRGSEAPGTPIEVVSEAGPGKPAVVTALPFIPWPKL